MSIGALVRRFRQEGTGLAVYTIYFLIAIINVDVNLRDELKLNQSLVKNGNKCQSKNLAKDDNVCGLKQTGPWRKLDRIKYAARLLFKIGILELIFFTVRRVLIILLGLNLFADFHYIDCFILGRPRFIGRANKISYQILFVVQIVVTSYRIVFRYTLMPMKLYALNFLLYDYEDVLANEVQIDRSVNSRDIDESKTSFYRNDNGRNQNYTMNTTKWRKNTISSNLNFYSHSNRHDDRFEPDLTFCFKNPFYLDEPDGGLDAIERNDKWILRLNRTSRSWTILSWCAVGAFAVFIFSILMLLKLTSSLIAGAICSDMGFEIGYPTCVAWIQKSQQQQHSNSTEAISLAEIDRSVPYSSIYLAPKVLASQMHIDDIPAIIPMVRPSMNVYSTTRIVVDIVANIYVYSMYFCIMLGSFSASFLCATDIIINAREIRSRLEKIIVTLRGDLNYKIDCSKSTPAMVSDRRLKVLEQEPVYRRRIAPGSRFHAAYWRKQNKNAFNDTQSKLQAEITHIQALLIDHFSLVQGYSTIFRFVSYVYFILCILHSLTTCIWISTIESRAVEYEFILTEIAFTLMAVVFFSSSAIIRTNNYRLYERIASATALDQHDGSKLRWLMIMNYYKPRSLYCITMLGSSEISWLFSLKFVAWYYSVLVVLANFYCMRFR